VVSEEGENSTSLYYHAPAPAAPAAAAAVVTAACLHLGFDAGQSTKGREKVVKRKYRPGPALYHTNPRRGQSQPALLAAQVLGAAVQ